MKRYGKFHNKKQDRTVHKKGIASHARRKIVVLHATIYTYVYKVDVIGAIY